jgi:hypothetical protein
MFSVCAIFYGDYPDLAKLLLSSLEFSPRVQDYRFGLNSVGSETRSYIKSWAASRCLKAPVYLYEELEGRNLGKYPLMRQMFLDRELADKVMWFDDDSHLSPEVSEKWWELVENASKNQIQLGAVHRIIQRNRQYEVIRQQPWYTNKPVGPRHFFEFATGGWWVADSNFLISWNYPFPDLYHNGGDSILGELLRQQGIKIARLPEAICCHCESCSKRPCASGGALVHINVGGRRGRRGIGVSDEKYVWADGKVKPDLSHQIFELKVTRYEI